MATSPVFVANRLGECVTATDPAALDVMTEIMVSEVETANQLDGTKVTAAVAGTTTIDRDVHRRETGAPAVTLPEPEIHKTKQIEKPSGRWPARSWR